jgi:hypothetical protein
MKTDFSVGTHLISFLERDRLMFRWCLYRVWCLCPKEKREMQVSRHRWSKWFQEVIRLIHIFKKVDFFGWSEGDQVVVTSVQKAVYVFIRVRENFYVLKEVQVREF